MTLGEYFIHILKILNFLIIYKPNMKTGLEKKSTPPTTWHFKAMKTQP